MLPCPFPFILNSGAGCAGKVAFPQDIHVSPECRELVSRLLKYQPEERIPLTDIPEHPWFHTEPAVDDVLQADPDPLQLSEAEVRPLNVPLPQLSSILFLTFCLTKPPKCLLVQRR